MSSDDPLVFPPTLREVLLRPRWLGVLALSLVVAAVFAWLGQWQFARSFAGETVADGATEQVRPIAEVVAPGQYLPEPYVGQRVEVRGSFAADDFVVVTNRRNDGASGYWVTGQFRVDTATPTSLAVAVGWTADHDAAKAAAAALDAAPPQRISLVGRLISDEGVVLARGDAPDEPNRMSPAVLLNLWHDADGVAVYRPYLTSQEAFGSLTPIHSPAPQPLSAVNWLNLFYAVEWAVFAGFAFYLWYRLAKDAWVKEVEVLTGSGDDDDDLE